MKIVNNVLLSINESDLKDGVFENEKVIEIADKCFYEMPSLRKVILPKVKKIGSDCFSPNQALTTIDLKALTTCGSDCFSPNQALTSVRINNHNLTTQNIDDYCFVIETEKTSKGIKILSGYNFVSVEKKQIKKDVCFVAEKDKFFAHGETIRKAVEDLNFKIISDKLKKEPIKKDTVITINYYRLITGACEFGVKNWMQQNGITKERFKAVDLLPLLEKTNAWGLQNFKKLITFSFFILLMAGAAQAQKTQSCDTLKVVSKSGETVYFKSRPCTAISKSTGRPCRNLTRDTSGLCRVHELSSIKAGQRIQHRERLQTEGKIKQ